MVNPDFVGKAKARRNHKKARGLGFKNHTSVCAGCNHKIYRCSDRAARNKLEWEKVV